MTVSIGRGTTCGGPARTTSKEAASSGTTPASGAAWDPTGSMLWCLRQRSQKDYWSSQRSIPTLLPTLTTTLSATILLDPTSAMRSAKRILRANLTALSTVLIFPTSTAAFTLTSPWGTRTQLRAGTHRVSARPGKETTNIGPDRAITTEAATLGIITAFQPAWERRGSFRQ